MLPWVDGLPKACFSKLNQAVSLLFWILTGMTTAPCFAYSTGDSINAIRSTIQPEMYLKQLRLSSIHFAPAIDSRINLGTTGTEYAYVLLKISTSYSPGNWYLNIDNTSLDSISIYQIYENGIVNPLYFGGTLVPFSNKRSYVWHTAPVNLTGKPAYILLCMKAAAKNINILYEILEKNKLEKKYRQLDRLVFFYTGAIGLIIMIVLLTFFLFKRFLLAVYLSYIICLSGWILSHYGYLFPIFFPHCPVLNEIVKPITNLGACYFLVKVMRMLFQKELEACRWLYYTHSVLSFFLPVLTASMLLLLNLGISITIKAGLMLAWHLGLLASIGVIIITPLYFYNTNITARIFSWAAIIMCVMAIVQLFSNFGFINNYFINEHGMTMASLAEVFIFSFGLLFSLVQEKQKKEKQVLDLEQKNSEILKMLITVQDNERKRIAGDLHDNIGPLLAALKINFARIIYSKQKDTLSELTVKTEAIIDDSIAEIRSIAHNLMPKGLASKGLINMLGEYFDSIYQLYHKNILFHHQIMVSLNHELQTNLYRITCELVLNAAKHSNASTITVHLVTNKIQVVLSVKDDGKGFEQNNDGSTLGLQNIAGRVGYLKGKLDLESQPGCGTSVCIEIPVAVIN